VESTLQPNKVLFETLQTRLINFVNARIQNGDFTERGLARILGISQPQIHNVLKGARKMRPELADRLIRKFDMSVLDLLEPGEIYTELLARGSMDPNQHGIATHIPPTRLKPGTETRKPSEQQQTEGKRMATSA